jgi:hypothetical protein
MAGTQHYFLLGDHAPLAYHLMMWASYMSVAETPTFIRQADDV